MTNDIRDYLTIPPHIDAIARACRYDLLHGPAWLLVPGGDVTRVTYDCLATYRDDLTGNASDGDIIEEAYSGTASDSLRDFIASLPTLYYLPDCGCYSTDEPEAWEDEETGEWVEPEPYHEVNVVAELWGKMFAREFN